MNRFTFVVTAVVSCGIATLITCTPKQAAQAVRSAGDFGACVIERDGAGDSNDAIATTCGAEVVEDVAKILTAEKKKMAKLKAEAPCPATSASAKAP